MCSMFQDGSTGGSWYSSGFRAKAKSGNVGAVSMILQSRYPKSDVNYSYGSFYQQRTTRLQLGAKSEKEIAFGHKYYQLYFSPVGHTFRVSRGHGLSALCSKYLLEFFQIDISWFPRAVDFCIMSIN